MDYHDIRRQLIDASLRLLKAGLLSGTSGNLSLRCADGSAMAITPSGVAYEELSPDMIPILNLEGAVIEGKRRPSSETPMHSAIMRRRADINAIVHTHSRFATILASVNQALPVVTIPMVVYAPDGVPVAPFALPGSKELGQLVADMLASGLSAVLLQHHGLLTVGDTLERALQCAECVEEAAQIAVYSRLLTGEVKGIPGPELERMLDLLREGRTL